MHPFVVDTRFRIICSFSGDVIIGIYVNKNIRLDTIHVYGFDYDYTLAHYSSNLQSLIYDLAKQHMVDEVGIIVN